MIGSCVIQIAVTNEQASIEVIGKQLGIKDIEAKVQAVRAARTEANEMIGGGYFAPLGSDTAYSRHSPVDMWTSICL